MIDEFLAKLRMYSAVKTHLQSREHQRLWLNQPPQVFTTLYNQFETGANDLGAFGDTQSQPTTGATQQQNLAETALEDAAHPLARALRLLLLAQGNQTDAEAWNLALTDWRRLQEQALLNRAKALQTALEATTQGATPTGTAYGITAAKVTDFNALVDAYEAVIGAPVAARASRKARTAELRPRFAAVDGLLADMDDLILQLRGSEAGDLFVAGYFNTRRLGDRSDGSSNPGGVGTTPPPENPPAPNP